MAPRCGPLVAHPARRSPRWPSSAPAQASSGDPLRRPRRRLADLRAGHARGAASTGSTASASRSSASRVRWDQVAREPPGARRVRRPTTPTAGASAPTCSTRCTTTASTSSSRCSGRRAGRTAAGSSTGRRRGAPTSPTSPSAASAPLSVGARLDDLERAEPAPLAAADDRRRSTSSGCSTRPTRRSTRRSATARVAGGVTAPRGNTGGVSPVQWIRGMGAAKARLDAYAHHPYPLRPRVESAVLAGLHAGGSARRSRWARSNRARARGALARSGRSGSG